MQDLDLDREGSGKVRVRLVTSGAFGPDVETANVVAEIRGRERPDEIVLIGAHLDSWDVGTGASDDAAGCIVTWEAARLMKKLGLDYESLKQLNPRLIYCSVTGFGQTGPYAQRPGYDLIAQGMSGLMASTGEVLRSRPQSTRTSPGIASSACHSGAIFMKLGRAAATRWTRA